MQTNMLMQTFDGQTRVTIGDVQMANTVKFRK